MTGRRNQAVFEELPPSPMHSCRSTKSDDPSKDYMFTLSCLSQGNPNDSVTVKVGGIELHNFLIDSGAACNVVNKSKWEWLKSKRIDANTRKSAKTLYAYGSTNPLPTLERLQLILL